MDILTHTLSGVAVATCAATFVPKVRDKVSLLFVGAFGGAFPDLDAISLWSRFDGTIGRFFNLPAKGNVIYGSKFWYSHHAFLHSLLGSVLFGAILMLIFYFLRKDKAVLKSFLKSKSIYFFTFVLAYWAHLAGDLPTPASVWGGIAFFWPSLDYVGGYGKIWWWNNYDIFLITVACIFLNLVVLSFSGYLKKKTRQITIAIFTLSLVFILVQINTRQFDYAYSTNSSRYIEMEKNSKLEQKSILGNSLYDRVLYFDDKLKIYF